MTQMGIYCDRLLFRILHDTDGNMMGIYRDRLAKTLNNDVTAPPNPDSRL